MIDLNKLIQSIINNPESSIYKENYRVKELAKPLPIVNKKRLSLIPWSGGLDSTACVLMAIESGIDAQTFYVDYGQTYAEAEKRHITNLRELIIDEYKLNWKLEPINIDIRSYYKKLIKNIGGEWGHIFPFRNFIIILKVIESYIHQKNYDPERITELWFPVVQGEIPYSGGDKSRIFISSLQKLLYEHELNIDLVTPIISLEKSDLIAWALNTSERWNVINHTYSCFSGNDIACSNCIACFRKIVAYGDNGVENQLDFPIDKDYILSEGHKYLQRFDDYPYYSKRRIQSTKKFLHRLQND